MKIWDAECSLCLFAVKSNIRQNMILTDSMIQKISEPGLWFYQSYLPMTDISNMVYELSVRNGVPVTILSSCNKRIQQNIIAMVRKDCIDTASDENERNWLEQEMAEYYTHGLFFHPQEMNDYVENGPFWSDYVHFNDEKWLNYSCCPYNVVLIEDLRVLCDYEGETDLENTLPMVHADAIERNKVVVVYISEKASESIANFIEKHLFS